MYRIVLTVVIVLLTVIDRLTKYAAVSTVKVNGPSEFLFGTMQFRYAENTGAAFSMFSENTLALTVISAIVLVCCYGFIMSKKIKPLFPNICLALIVSGGLGNVIDRALYGFVVDFIEPLFIDFAVFNFADICITVGAFMLIGYEIYDLVKEKKTKKAAEND